MLNKLRNLQQPNVTKKDGQHERTHFRFINIVGFGGWAFINCCGGSVVMEIRLNKAWVIYSSANESGIILGKIPEKQQETYINSSKFAGQKYHYSTIFGAIQGAFKHGLNSSSSQSFLELEQTIESIAKECQSAFTSESLKVLHSEKVKELQSEIEALKAQLKKKVAA